MIVGPAFPLAVHSSIAAVNRTYEELGWPLPPWEEWDGGVPPGVLVVPPTAARGGLDALPRKVCAMVTGWGLDAGARFQYRVDEVFPLTDHADYPDLLQLVEMVGPARVLTTHGFAAEFSRDLRQRGYSAWSLSGVDQMDLALEIPAPPLARRVLPDAAADGAGEFAALARLAVQVGQVPERVDKVALLAGWLAGISPEESLATAVRFLSGKTAASAPERRLIRTEWPVLQSALSLASGFSPRKIKELTRGQSDHGKNTSLVLADQRCDAAQWSLTEVCALFQAVGQAASTGVRAQLLAGAFRRMRTPESGLLAGILSGDLHVGLKHGIVEAAISLAFRQPEVLVREALRLTGDAGLTAILARAGTLDSAGPLPFYPVHREALPGLSGLPVEWHHAEGRTALYATDFRCLNTAFPVFVGNGGIASEVIVRGGIIAPGSVLKLRDLPADKAWRSEPDLFCGEAAGPRFRMVDLLWLDGKSLLNEPLAFRRKLLAGLTWHPPFEVAAGCA